MIISKERVHFDLLNQKMVIIELKLEKIQLENEILSFRVGNLAHEKDVNAKEVDNEAYDDIMDID